VRLPKACAEKEKMVLVPGPRMRRRELNVAKDKLAEKGGTRPLVG